MPQDPPDWVRARRREIGQRIRTYRKAARLSQEKLGEAAGGLDRRTISGFEWGSSDPTLTDLLRLAEALGVPVTALLVEE